MVFRYRVLIIPFGVDRCSFLMGPTGFGNKNRKANTEVVSENSQLELIRPNGIPSCLVIAFSADASIRRGSAVIWEGISVRSPTIKFGKNSRHGGIHPSKVGD